MLFLGLLFFGCLTSPDWYPSFHYFFLTYFLSLCLFALPFWDTANILFSNFLLNFFCHYISNSLFANYSSDTRLISTTYKELKQLDSKKPQIVSRKSGQRSKKMYKVFFLNKSFTDTWNYSCLTHAMSVYIFFLLFMVTSNSESQWLKTTITYFPFMIDIHGCG